MTCSRCHGLLIAERLLEFYEPAPKWRCINCGRPAMPSPSHGLGSHAVRSQYRPRIANSVLHKE